ncbi:protein kinase domain-containing protein [Nocardia nepalensis]|uniref:protein kinase domain-containing protein n=1 Tax=Nocardia nepalensis TaxID=3375448 RepID=UPI003B675B3D
MDETESRAGTRFGPYELRALLGRGGMGEVYEAYDAVKDRVVAVKLLPIGLAGDPRFEQRFRHESRVAARLAEPHIVPIHDWGEIEGVLYIDMRLVRGSDLRSVLRDKGPLSPARAVGIIEQVAAALDAAHAEGLVHRDVKPANILVTPSDFAYLADFGIARSENDPSVTATGQAIGSYSYIAPERFDVTPIGGTADVYSLACVLFECLTGAQPFPSDGMSSLIRAHLSTPPPRPTTKRAGLPAALDEVIARGMAKEPADRYPTAGALAAASRAAVSGGSSMPNSELPTSQIAHQPSRAAPTIIFPAFGPESTVGRQSAGGPQPADGPQSPPGPQSSIGPQSNREPQPPAGPPPGSGPPSTGGPQSVSGSQLARGPQSSGAPQSPAGPQSASGPRLARGPQSSSGPQPRGPQPTAGAQSASGSQQIRGPQSTSGSQSARGPQSTSGPQPVRGAQPSGGPQSASGQAAVGPQSASGSQPTGGPQSARGPQSTSGPQPTGGAQSAGGRQPSRGPQSTSGPHQISGLEPTIVPRHPSDPMRREIAPLDATTEALAKTANMPMPQSDAPYPPDRAPAAARRSPRIVWIGAVLVVLAIAGVVGWYARDGFGDRQPPTTTPPAHLPAGAKPCAQVYPALGRFTSSAIGTTVTSCAFAEEVRKAYADGGNNTITDRSVMAHSPVNNRDYKMNCTAGDQFATCSGGENAIVYVY